MSKKLLKYIFEHKLRTYFVIFGIAICFLGITSVDGMLEYMIANRNNEAARLTDNVLMVPYGSEYPPYRNLISSQTVESAFNENVIDLKKSTPMIFLVLGPADNPMDTAGIIGLGMKAGCEKSWIGDIQASTGTATLIGQNSNSVILGKKAAEFYHVKSIGETITISDSEWKVAGILKEVNQLNYIDTNRLVIMQLKQVQSKLNMDGLVSAILLSPKAGCHDVFQKTISKAYPSFEIYTYNKLHAKLMKEMDMPRKFLYLLILALILIVIMLIYNTIILWIQDTVQNSEIERIKSIHLFYIILLKSLLFNIIGGSVGLLTAMKLAYLLGWPWILTGHEIIRILVIILLTGLITSIFPIFYAVKNYSQSLQYRELQNKVEKIGADRYAINAAYHNLIQVREEERNRLSHDLHDQVIQDLIGLKFIIAEKAPEVQSYMQDEINTTITMIRDICSDLKPPALETLGLAAVLESYTKKFMHRNDIDIELKFNGIIRRLSPEVELALFRIIQESLNNIWKHAKSALAIVLLEFNNDSISLCISDNGCGFFIPESLKDYVDKGHFGLMNMLERAEAIGGEISIESTPGQGTKIKIFIPKC